MMFFLDLEAAHCGMTVPAKTPHTLKVGCPACPIDTHDARSQRDWPVLTRE